MPAARTLLLGLLLSTPPPSAAEPALQHKLLSRAASAEPILALSFVGEGRVLALAAGSLSLWRVDDGPPRIVARSAWAVTTPPVRHGGAVIVGTPSDGAAWLLSSYLERAQLVRVEGPRLVLVETADAAPWPQAPAGLRYKSGTNLVEGMSADAELDILALDPMSRAVVREDGTLLLDATPAGIRVGSAIASAWPGMLLASADRAPAGEDRVIAWRRTAGAWEECWSIALPGTVSALAARGDSRRADVLVALRTATGAELVHLELRSPR
jgi:hypothetical protein